MMSKVVLMKKMPHPNPLLAEREQRTAQKSKHYSDDLLALKLKVILLLGLLLRAEKD
jgi:hypothetical protein